MLHIETGVNTPQCLQMETGVVKVDTARAEAAMMWQG